MPTLLVHMYTYKMYQSLEGNTHPVKYEATARNKLAATTKHNCTLTSITLDNDLYI